MRDIIEVVGVTAVIVAAVAALVYGLVSYSCNGYQIATGKPTKMQAMECYVQDNGAWYKWEEYKYRLATKGQMK